MTNSAPISQPKYVAGPFLASRVWSITGPDGQRIAFGGSQIITTDELTAKALTASLNHGLYLLKYQEQLNLFHKLRQSPSLDEPDNEGEMG